MGILSGFRELKLETIYKWNIIFVYEYVGVTKLNDISIEIKTYSFHGLKYIKFHSYTYIVHINMSTFSFLYKELSEELINSARNVDSLTEYIKSRNSGVTDEDVAYVKRNISQRFLPLFNKRWFAETQNIARFFCKQFSLACKWVFG